MFYYLLFLLLVQLWRQKFLVICSQAEGGKVGPLAAFRAGRAAASGRFFNNKSFRKRKLPTIGR
jgi:hypothetical protein